MCLSCSQFCGRCRPALVVAVSCPSCGVMAEISRGECLDALGYRTQGRAKPPAGYVARCPECGADLNRCIAEAVKPMDCLRSGIVCGYPCGRCMKEFFPGDLVCTKQVPLGKIGSVPEATENFNAMSRIKKRKLTLIEM